MNKATKTTDARTPKRGISQAEMRRFIEEGLSLTTIAESRMTSSQLGEIVAEWSRRTAGA
jgi:hypothetical protein